MKMLTAIIFAVAAHAATAAAEISDDALYSAFVSTNDATRRAWIDDADMRKRMISLGTPPRGAPETGVPQWYKVEGTENVRDVGGWKGLGSRNIRKGMVLRSAYLEKVKDKFLFRTRYKIKTDLDLRDVNKMTHLKGRSPLGGNVELVIDVGAPAYEAWDTKSGRRYFRKVFALLSDSEKYPIVIHCHKGADRTGSLVFLMQGLLGMTESDLRLDWQLTAFCNENMRFRDADRYDKLFAMISARDGATLTDKFVSYAHDCGISDDEIAEFRSIMLEDVGK